MIPAVTRSVICFRMSGVARDMAVPTPENTSATMNATRYLRMYPNRLFQACLKSLALSIWGSLRGL